MNGENIRPISWLVASIIALGLVLSSMAIGFSYMQTKARQSTITVTGSAKKQIKSDFVVWKGNFNEQSKDIAQAYNLLKADLAKVKTYLVENGVDEKEITILPINTIVNYVILPNGQWSSAVDSYKLVQEIEIKSADIDKITGISRESTKLINDGIKFQSMPPQYFYTKIADMKIDMLALATKDAKSRADKIALNTDAKIKKLNSAKMGVFQITPLYSNEVSDYGINDTSSIEKEVMAVVNCVFETK